MSEIRKLAQGESSVPGKIYGKIQAVPQSMFRGTPVHDDDGIENEPIEMTLTVNSVSEGQWKDITVISGLIIIYPVSANSGGCKDGIDGIDGLSAYEVWLAEGNVGTEQEFLDSLKGANGSPADVINIGNSDLQIDGDRSLDLMTNVLHINSSERKILQASQASVRFFNSSFILGLRFGQESIFLNRQSFFSNNVAFDKDVAFGHAARLFINNQEIKLKKSAPISTVQGIVDALVSMNLLDETSSIDESALVGPQGEPGADGIDGLSAYEVWLAEGNVGTEQEFLDSLKGEAGSFGGDNIILNNTESFYFDRGEVYSEFGKVKMVEGNIEVVYGDLIIGQDPDVYGVQFAKLIIHGQEIKLKKHAPISTVQGIVDALISMNLLDETSSIDESALVGPKGDTGPQGERGFEGARGFDGAKGDTGPQGERGFEGARGFDGAKGDTGPQGERGFEGPQGEQGSPGYSNYIGYRVNGQNTAVEIIKTNLKNIDESAFTPVFTTGSGEVIIDFTGAMLDGKQINIQNMHPIIQQESVELLGKIKGYTKVGNQLIVKVEVGFENYNFTLQNLSELR